MSQTSQLTPKQHRTRIRIRPSAIYFGIFLAGLFARPYVQFCLQDASIELRNNLGNPANKYGGLEDPYNERATDLYTPSELAKMERIDRQDHPIGQVTLTVIFIAIVIIFARWAGRLERRPIE